MRLGCCFSAGKDSTLAALLLSEHFDVHLLTGTFGVTDDWTLARDVAEDLGFPFERVSLDEGVAHQAVDRALEDGYPRNAIQLVHEHMLETVAERGANDDQQGDPFDAIADGTRRDDRTPVIDRPTAQSLEDRFDVHYVAPLAGFSRGAIDDLTEQLLTVETGPSEEVGRADYEAELRVLIDERAGPKAVDEIFPAHVQSRVTGLCE